MSVDLVLVTALGSTVAKIGKQLYPILKDSVGNGGQEQKSEQPLRLHLNGNDVEIQNPHEVSPELVDSLRVLAEGPRQPSGDPLALSRQAVAKVSAEELKRRRSEVTPSAEVGGALLAMSADAVFRDARRRIDLVFKLNLGVAIVLAVILVGGIGGAVVSAVFLGKTVWAVVFGGISAGDLIGAYALKPLTAINSAIIATQRLEAVHLRMSQQLRACGAHENLDERIRCQTVVWEAIQKDLATLSGV